MARLSRLLAINHGKRDGGRVGLALLEISRAHGDHRVASPEIGEMRASERGEIDLETRQSFRMFRADERETMAR